MSVAIRIAVLALTLISTSAVTQEQSKAEREFLRPIEPQKKLDLETRRGFEIAKEKYFAKPGRFEIFEFDLDVLESKGNTITFTPFEGSPIEVLSQGIARDSRTGWFLGTWNGELKEPGLDETSSVSLTITTWGVDENGDLGAPDPNREHTLAVLRNQRGVISEESLLRVDQEQVYSIEGELALPGSNAVIRFRHPSSKELDYLMVYEVDHEKTLLIPNDLATNVDTSTEFGREKLRRDEAFRAHVDGLKRQFGIAQTEE